MLNHFNHVWLFTIPWTVACQASLSMEFPRQEYWSGLPCPSPRDLPSPGVEPMSLMSPALAGRFFTLESQGLGENGRKAIPSVRKNPGQDPSTTGCKCPARGISSLPPFFIAFSFLLPHYHQTSRIERHAQDKPAFTAADIGPESGRQMSECHLHCWEGEFSEENANQVILS